MRKLTLCNTPPIRPQNSAGPVQLNTPLLALPACLPQPCRHHSPFTFEPVSGLVAWQSGPETHSSCCWGLGCPPLSGPLPTHCSIYSPIPPRLLHPHLRPATAVGPHTSFQDPRLSFCEDVLTQRGLLCHGVIILGLLGERQPVSPVLKPRHIPALRGGSNLPRASLTFIISWVPCIAAALMGVSLCLAVILSCIFLAISHIQRLFTRSLAICVSS